MLYLSGCVATPQTSQLLADPGVYSEPVELTEVPFYPQEEYQCGPAALATVLAFSGVGVKPEDLVSKVYVPERKGSFQLEMLAAARNYQRIPYVIEPHLKDLLEEVKSGRPVLVLQNLGLDWYPQWHYAVVVGFDLESQQLVLRSGEIERRLTPLDTFENTWRRSNFWGAVMLPPGELPALANEQRYFLSLSAYMERRNDTSVYPALQAGVEQWPASIPLNMALANYFYLNREIGKTVDIYQRVIAANPEYAPAYNNAALVLLELGDREQALAYANRAVELGGAFKDQYLDTLNTVQTTP